MCTALCAVLLAAGLGACGQGGESPKKSETATQVAVLTPTSIQLPRSFVADVQAVQFVEVKPKVEGFVEEIFVDEGQRVKKGQPLFRLSAQEYSEHVKEAESALKQAQAERKMADYEVARIRSLVEKDILSKVRLEQAQAEQEVARHKVQQAQVQLQRSRNNLSYTLISSPFDGVVDGVPHKRGSLVTPNDLLTSVTDVREVFVYYRLNESDYLRQRRAQLSGEQSHAQQQVQLLLPDGTTYGHMGRVEAVEGDFERGTGSIGFRARFPNPDGLLKHGVSGKVQMTTTLENICLVPQKSTFEIQDFTYVFLVDKEGKVQVRSFEPMARYKNFYVTQDLPAHSTIVYEGVQLVKDGMTVQADTVTFKEIAADLKVKLDLTSL